MFKWLLLIISLIQARARRKPKVVNNNYNEKNRQGSALLVEYPRLLDILSIIDCKDNSSYNDRQTQKQAFAFLSEEAILYRATNCESYHEIMDIFGRELSGARLSLASESPLGFSHSIHQQAGILEVFLALTFRPGDSHCFHIDAKASDVTAKAIKAVISCYNQRYPNTTVLAVQHPTPVYWGHFSVLEASFKLHFENAFQHEWIILISFSIWGWSAMHQRALAKGHKMEILYESCLFRAAPDYGGRNGQVPLVIEKKCHRLF